MVFADILRKNIGKIVIFGLEWNLLYFQPIGSDGTSSDEENFENDRVESDFDVASTSSEENDHLDGLMRLAFWPYEIFNVRYRELDSDFFLKEPSSGIGLIFLTDTKN